MLKLPRQLLHLAAFALLLAALPAGAADRALIVAVGTNPAFHKLDGPATDAGNMQQFALETLAYASRDVRMLTERGATREAVLESLNQWLIEGTQPGDRVLFYFSGHGVQVPDRNGDEKDDYLDEALILFDTTCRKRSNGACLSEALSQHLLDDEIDAALGKLSGRKVTVIIDSCHAGTASRGLRPSTLMRSTGAAIVASNPVSAPAAKLGSYLETSLLDGGKERVVWSAVSPAQIALDSREATPVTGVFTSLFLEGAGKRRADTNRDGTVTHTELIDWLRSRSEGYCNRHPNDCLGALTPMLEAPASMWLAPIEASLSDRIPTAATVVAASETALPAIAASPELRLSIKVVDEQGRALREPYRRGQIVRLLIEANFDGELLLLGIDPANRLEQLFPNRLSEASMRVQANKPFEFPAAEMPFDMEVDEPFGRHRLIALVTADAVDLSDLTGAKSRNVVVEAASAPVDYFSLIAERLRQPWANAEGVRRSRWAIARLDYRTVSEGVGP